MVTITFYVLSISVPNNNIYLITYLIKKSWTKKHKAKWVKSRGHKYSYIVKYSKYQELKYLHVLRI